MINYHIPSHELSFNSHICFLGTIKRFGTIDLKRPTFIVACFVSPGHRKAAKRRTLKHTHTNQSRRNFAHCLRYVWASRQHKYSILHYLWFYNEMHLNYAQCTHLISIPRLNTSTIRTTESLLSLLRKHSCKFILHAHILCVLVLFVYTSRYARSHNIADNIRRVPDRSFTWAWLHVIFTLIHILWAGFRSGSLWCVFLFQFSFNLSHTWETYVLNSKRAKEQRHQNVIWCGLLYDPRRRCSAHAF